MIGFLIALHPKRWRNDYGAEYQALLEESPMTVRVILDILRNAGRLHVTARRTLLRVLAALALSSIGEVIAVQGGYADNILWIPSSAPKALLLVAVLLPWALVISTTRRDISTRSQKQPFATRQGNTDV